MAGPNDFTNQNIQDTYQRVLQISSSGEVTDGTGSLVPILKMTASHAVVETSFETSSSYAESASVADRTDTVTNSTNSEHYVTFVDSNNATLTPETHYTAPFFYVNPAKRFVFVEGRLQVKGSDIWIESGSISASNSIYAAGSITASGNISASGDINAGQGGTGSFDHIVTQGSTIEFRNGATKLGAIKMTGTGDMTIADSSTGKSKLKIADLGVTDASSEVRIRNGQITASSDISASGVIYATQFSTSGGGGFGSIQVSSPGGEVVIQNGRVTASVMLQAPRLTFNSTQTSYIEEGNIVFATSGKNSFFKGGIDGIDQGQPFIGSDGAFTFLLDQGGSGDGFFNIKKDGATPHLGTNIFRIDNNGNITASGDISGSNRIDASTIAAVSNYRLQDQGGTSRHFIAGPKAGSVSNNSVAIGNANFTNGIQIINDVTASGVVKSTGGFVGDLTGNADTVTVTTDAGNTDHYILYSDSTTGQRTPKADTSLKFNGSTNTLTTTTIEASNINVTNLTPTFRKYTPPEAGAGNSVEGDIISGLGTDAAGGADLLVSGRFYVLTNGLKWVPVDADQPASSSGLVGYCITSRRTDFLLKGFIQNTDISYLGSIDGAPLYISTGSGFLQNCKPGSGDVGRIIGYTIDASGYSMFMDPDKTWVKIT